MTPFVCDLRHAVGNITLKEFDFTRRKQLEKNNTTFEREGRVDLVSTAVGTESAFLFERFSIALHFVLYGVCVYSYLGITLVCKQGFRKFSV